MNRRIEVTGTLKIDLNEHPFADGETLWAYAERQLREVGLGGVYLADVSGGLQAVGVTRMDDPCPRHASGHQWVTAYYHVPPGLVVREEGREDPT